MLNVLIDRFNIFSQETHRMVNLKFMTIPREGSGAIRSKKRLIKIVSKNISINYAWITKEAGGREAVIDYILIKLYQAFYLCWNIAFWANGIAFTFTTISVVLDIEKWMRDGVNGRSLCQLELVAAAWLLPVVFDAFAWGYFKFLCMIGLHFMLAIMLAFGKNLQKTHLKMKFSLRPISSW